MAKQNPTRTTARTSQSSPAPSNEVPAGGRRAPRPTTAGTGGGTKTVAPAARSAPPARPQVARPQAAGSTRFAGLQRTFRETVAELRRVQWPDRMTTRNLTLVVIGMSLFLALVLGGVDWGLGRLVEWLIGL